MSRMRYALLVPLLLGIVSGCASRQPAASSCDVFTPPPLATQDVDALSDQMAVWLDETITKGERLCGW